MSRLFQAAPRVDQTHRDLGLIENKWYFWDQNFREVQGGYDKYEQADMHMRQVDAALRQCSTGACED